MNSNGIVYRREVVKHFKFHYNMTLESTSGTGAPITLVAISNFGGFSESYESKIW